MLAFLGRFKVILACGQYRLVPDAVTTAKGR